MVDEQRHVADPFVKECLLRPGKLPFIPHVLFETCEDLQLFPPNSNRVKLDANLQLYFTEEEEEAAYKLAANPPPDADALHRLECDDVSFAIDNVGTTEVDDSVGIHRDSEGNDWIQVHIADPSRFILPNSDVDLMARARAATVYLPESKHLMIPSSMIPVMSLSDEHPAPSLTFSFLLDDNGGIHKYKITPTTQKNVQFVNYEQVDSILSGDTEHHRSDVLKRLFEVAERRTAHRRSRGGISVNLPKAEPSVVVHEDSTYDITLNIRNERSAADRLVEEMMVSASEIAANYSVSHGIPVIFRRQSPKDAVPEELLPWERVMQKEYVEDIPQLVEDYAKVQGMVGAELSPMYGLHSGLGLSAYATATSPIRRYADLLAHQQIKASLRGSSLPFSASDVVEISGPLINTFQEVARVQRGSIRFWVLKAIQDRNKHLHNGVVVDWYDFQGKPKCSVHLTEFGIRVNADFRSGDEPPRIGSTVEVETVVVSPISGMLLARLAPTGEGKSSAPAAW
eukprot:GFYU01024664.1.p1 GENE.GFYU01024664.1~~GFYU01024664.1.p1  ORF type:complete len:534 (-),score=85.42 GFYU01024664.1:157-1692(-)